MKHLVRTLFFALNLFAGVHSTLAQPALSITPEGNQALLNWPAAATNYVLQSTTNLNAPNWLPVGAAAPGTILPVAYDSPARFFRLFPSGVVPAGMALIPAGSFIIGNSLGEPDPDNYIPNPTNVTVSAFYMDTNLVSYSQWQTVYAYATNQGYTFAHAGDGKAANHPVQSVDWYDMVKWCNARSQQAGLAPAYYTDAGLTQVYTNGAVAPYVNWSANGYRLPTEAEWEKAARGGLSGQRFPWGNTISWSQANYYGLPLTLEPSGYAYDLATAIGYNPAFQTGGAPFTSPVGSFPANGYGLYDMAGNVLEWCWDWFDDDLSSVGSPYAGGTDPRGPVSSPYGSRILRSGLTASLARCGSRSIFVSPLSYASTFGFRCVRGH